MAAGRKLDFAEREKNKQFYDLHLDLIKLRREDSRFREQIPGGVDGAVLGPASFVLRFFATENDDRLLVVNFGNLQLFEPAPEPWLAPPLGFEWETLWSSESPRYGGSGSPTSSPATCRVRSRSSNGCAGAPAFRNGRHE